MNSKNLYDEGEINENEEEDEEIIDNEDEEFDDSIHKPIKSNELQNINEKENEKNNQIKNDLNINHPLFNIQLKKEEPKLDNTIERVKNEVKNIVAETTLTSLDNNTLKLTNEKLIEKPKENKNENLKKKEIENTNNNNNINLENYTKEDLISLLVNNPINVNNEEEEEEEEREEEINLNLNFNTKIPEEPENEEDDDTDFNKALNKVLSNMAKNKNIDNNQLYDLLVSDKDIVENELKKYNFNKNINISSKIQNYIDKKNKNINEIKQKKEEEFKQKYTFTPVINKKNNINNKKRNLNQFLKDQEEYQQKINEKITNIKDSQIKKEEEELKLKPKIQITSEKMAQEKYKGEEVFKRLYNKPQKKIFEVKKNEKTHKNNNNSNVNEEYLNNLYQDAKLREKKNKEKESLENKKRKEAIQYKAASTSNKYLYNKFKNLYKIQIEKIITKINKKKLDFNQLKILFINLNFIPQSQSENEKMNNLLKEIYENLKDDQGSMSIDHIFIFCLSILSLFEYYILSNYKMNENISTIQTESNDNQREIVSSISQKNLKYNHSSNKLLQKNYSVKTVSNNDEISSKLDIINRDLLGRIVNYVKYGGFDLDNNFIITCNHSKLISKNFISFYQYYNNPNLYKDEIKDNNLNNNKIKTYKKISTPITNNNNNHKIKIQERSNRNIIQNNTENKRQNKSTSNSKRIEQLYLESAKKRNHLEKEKEKYLEQKEKEERKICTFRPKINSNSQYKNNIIPVGQNGNLQELRMEMLYKKGTENLLNKKDKTLEEIELEKNKKELTFKPNIKEVNYNMFNKNLNIDDYDIQKFNKRLQKGREERELRISALERGEFLINNQRNFSDNKNIIKRDFGFSENNNKKKKSFIENKTPGKERSNIYYFNNINNNKININKHENETPILQIDVNLKHGMKKKVYVYEGDTSENLAKEFSEENGLDDKMRKKLQMLIQQEIDKLLTKIDEESQSTFKSNNKNF